MDDPILNFEHQGKLNELKLGLLQFKKLVRREFAPVQKIGSKKDSVTLTGTEMCHINKKNIFLTGFKICEVLKLNKLGNPVSLRQKFLRFWKVSCGEIVGV